VRKLGVGGSDVGAILGLNPWCSAFEVYLSKVGEIDGRSGSEPARWGHRLEPIIAEWAGEELRAVLHDSPGVLGAADHPWMLANVDRFAETADALSVLECKLTRWQQGWAEEAIPERFEAQAHWYLRVTGLDVAYLAVLIGGTHAELRRVERNERIEAFLINRAEAFWECVQRREPPMPGTTAGDARAINAILAASPATSVELDSEWSDRLASLAEIKAAEKRLDTMRRQLENQLKLALGSASEGWLDGRRVATWKPQRGRFKEGEFFKAHPELVALADHYRSDAYRVLRTINPEEEA
jgi:putative phage-type endonuclease